jgi:hypothetical protein
MGAVMMKRCALALSLSLVLAACDGGTADPLVRVDAGPLADSGPNPEMSRALAVATDFQSTGILSQVTVPDLVVTQDVVAGVASTDPVLRKLDRLYVINRFGADNITILEPDSLTLVDQFSTGAGSNPQDVAEHDGKLYVVGLGIATVEVFDPSNLAGGAVDSIDLSALDVDGQPNCGSIAAVGARLFVACALYDENFAPRGPGVVAVIDPVDGDYTTITLDYASPIGLFRARGAELLLATVPSFGDLTMGCVERISAGETVPAASCLIDNAALGGYASGIAPIGDTGPIWFSTVTGFDPEDFGALGTLRKYDPTGAALGASVSPAEQRILDVAACPTGELFVADSAGGARVYRADGDELSTGLLDLGLPPVQGGLTCY